MLIKHIRKVNKGDIYGNITHDIGNYYIFIWVVTLVTFVSIRTNLPET